MTSPEVIRVEATFSPIRIHRFLRPSTLRPRKFESAIVSSEFMPVYVRQGFPIAWSGRPFVSRAELIYPKTLAVPSPHTLEIMEKPIEETPIGPGETNKATARLSQLFSQFKNDVFGELAYIDHTTPELLESINNKLGLKLLTSATSGKGNKIASEFETKHAQRRTLSLTKITLIEDSDEKPWFHTRWLSDGKILVDVGTDLKKATLGKKEHTITSYSTRPDSERIMKFEWYCNSSEQDISKRYSKRARKQTVYQRSRSA